MSIDLNKFYKTSSDVVARQIEDELVIVPVRSGIGDLDAEMFALNKTGIAVWNKLNGDLSLSDIIDALSAEYRAPHDEIKADVIELLGIFEEKGLVVESQSGKQTP